jgi:hypothetical protein
MLVYLQNGEVQTVFDYVETYLGHEYDDRWLFTLSTFLIAVGLSLLIIIGHKKVNHLKR